MGRWRIEGEGVKAILAPPPKFLVVFIGTSILLDTQNCRKVFFRFQALSMNKCFVPPGSLLKIISV